MTFDNLVFIEHLPTIDLHGYDRDTARLAINDFIEENRKLKQEFCVIIHGIGSGVLRKETSETLKRNAFVLDFKTYYYNQGCTIVQIRLS